ncbi:ABC transporter ATP-binding protein [Eubacterium sp.]
MGIKLESVTKKVSNDKIILNNVNIEVNDGEMVAIIGKSGAGKSTLLHILGCLDEMTTGKYLLDNKEINKMSKSKKAELRNKTFGYVMQDFGLINEDTVFENIALPLYLSSEKKKNINSKVMEQIKDMDIENIKDIMVEKISGGEKQRVAIARALVNNPKYILADEPTGALDRKNANNVMDILQKLKRDGKTVIVITHDIDIANKCDRQIEISDGEIIR